MKFRKSHGLTASERLLANLCERSFLRLWTYPNLFKRAGKELSDLLVVFREEVIIFSDKSCAYPETGNAQLDWQRWFRRAVAASAHQIHEAERWIRAKPTEVYLDPKCTERLPLQLPDPSRMKVHRICVVTGAAARCRAATGRDALAIDLDVLDDASPFTIGRLQKERNWIHIFDEAALQRVLSELDTISDFLGYLEAKSKLLQEGHFKAAACEEDLLAHYLWNGRNFPHDGAPYSLRKNLWLTVENDRQFQAGRRENHVSSFWDGFIEYITDHYLDGLLEFGNELDMTEYERMVRKMAAEPRFHRRILSKAILERADRAREGKIGSLLPSSDPEVVYALLIGRGAPREQYAEYRLERSRELQLRCFAAKIARPEVRYVVGIALDARGVEGSAEDFLLLDTQGLTEQELARAARIRQELGYWIEGQVINARMVEDEYPTA